MLRCKMTLPHWSSFLGGLFVLVLASGCSKNPEAQFAWHGDEPITVILPDGPQLQFKVLGNAEAVQRWYIELNREVIAKKGKDYIGDKSRWFWFGDHGNLFTPGVDRSV